MREHLFRGQIVGTKDWAIGSLVYSPSENQYYIVEHCDEELSFPVIPETVGQFTGLTDKNGKKIFEGDIVKQVPIRKYDMPTLLATDVIFASGMWGVVARFPSWVACSYIKDNKVFKALREYYYRDNNTSEIITGIEIIGKLHDNPELLEIEE